MRGYSGISSVSAWPLSCSSVRREQTAIHHKLRGEEVSTKIIYTLVSSQYEHATQEELLVTTTAATCKVSD
jgi:hypothetical protein